MLRQALDREPIPQPAGGVLDGEEAFLPAGFVAAKSSRLNGVMVVRVLMEQLMCIDSESFFEKPMIDFVKGWIGKHASSAELLYEGEETGLLYRMKLGPRAGQRRPLLFMAHLDTKGTARPVSGEKHFSFERHRGFDNMGIWRFPKGGKAVGVDDRTGIAVILAMMRGCHLKEQGFDRVLNPRLGYDILCLFTVREEVGQLGSISLDFSRIAEHAPRFGIAIDRHSHGKLEGGGQAQGRHFVRKYMGLELLPPNDDLYALIQASDFFPEHPCGGDSRNCADTLELKARWLCEHVLPSIDPDSPLIARYEKEKEDVIAALTPCGAPDPRDRDRPARVGMRQSPRRERYRTVVEVGKHVGAQLAARPRKEQEEYALSVINLSMDLPKHSLELHELHVTRAILARFMWNYANPEFDGGLRRVQKT